VIHLLQQAVQAEEKIIDLEARASTKNANKVV
jgi:hypothetical protein